MGWIKKPITVKCYSTKQLGNLLDWQRSQLGLTGMNAQRFEVTAVMRHALWDKPEEVMYFEVSVPYSYYKKLRDTYVKAEAFDPILAQRAFDEILKGDW